MGAGAGEPAARTTAHRVQSSYAPVMVELSRTARNSRSALGLLAALAAFAGSGCTVDGDECIAECSLDGSTMTGVAFVQDTEQGPNHTEELTVAAHHTACTLLCGARARGGDAGTPSQALLSCKDRCLRQSTVEIRCQRAERPWAPRIWLGR